MEVRIARGERDHLGEGPCWLPDERALLRVDITAGLVHRWNPATGEQRTEHFEGQTGAAVPRTGGGMVVAVDRRLVLVDPDGARRELLEVEPGLDGNRFNDCRADPGGRLWAGTMSTTRAQDTAALYRVEPDGSCRAVLTGLTLSNGIAWTAAGDAMYHVDSPAHRIDRYDFDASTGELGECRPLVQLDPAGGMPDGICTDAEGGVWVCLFGGGELRRYDASGELTECVPLHVTNPTCPAFGGEDLSTLYVTTSRHTLSPEEERAQPAAGCVLVLEPGVRGLPGGMFAG